MYTLIIILLASSNWASTFETDHIFFKEKTTCIAARDSIHKELNKQESIEYIIDCHKL